jgi:hypothetical protein
MLKRTQAFAAVLLLCLAAAPGCDPRDRDSNRWVTTANTNVKIDWDKVNEAYKQANGPEELEKKINEIYEGDEIISIAVQDQDDKTQVVTGFFDKNSDGQVAEEEKIFTIQRQITGEGEAQVQTVGHGYYAGYASPMFSIMSGMVMGSMLSSMFAPSYVPMYSRAYVTPGTRASQLRSQRSGYRAQNPGRFAKPSQSGRSYGGSRPSGGFAPRSRGGSRFGLRAPIAGPRLRLAA